MKTLFIVDDNIMNLMTAKEALTGHYNVITLSSAGNMFELLKDVQPDLILLDILMPVMNGFEALERLKADPNLADIPVIFLTSKTDTDTEIRGFELGVIDFIGKPFSKPVLLNRIRAHLEIEDIIRVRTEKLIRLQSSMVSVLANMVENRDKLTGKHIERTAKYIEILLRAMIESGLYSSEIEEWTVEGIVNSARLHDLGKIVVSDLILNKPGKLTDEEYESIKTHAAEGENIISDIVNEAGYEDFLFNAKLLAGSHHERWDGRGYPRGLKGEDIPLQGRVMAIADVYDALVSERPYKEAYSHVKSVGIIRENSGTQFDPQLVSLFLQVSDLFAEVAQ